MDENVKVLNMGLVILVILNELKKIEYANTASIPFGWQVDQVFIKLPLHLWDTEVIKTQLHPQGASDAISETEL